MGVEVAIVVGGGNFWRGRSSGNMDRTRADHMGMLATVINALGVADALEQLGLNVRVQTAIAMQEVAEPYIRNKAVRHLEKGRVVVYDSDPKANPNAVKYDKLSFMDVLNQDLKVMDSTAASLCKDNDIALLVFNIDKPENIVKAICGESVGTLVE